MSFGGFPGPQGAGADPFGFAPPQGWPGGGATGGMSNVAVVKELLASATSGGTATAGSWFTRTFSTEVSDPGELLTLASNQMTVVAGTYMVHASCMLSGSPGSHQARLRDITNSATLLLGSVCNSNAMRENAQLSGVITLADTTVIELQHRCSTTVSTYGMGGASSQGQQELFAEVIFVEVA